MLEASGIWESSAHERGKGEKGSGVRTPGPEATGPCGQVTGASWCHRLGASISVTADMPGDEAVMRCAEVKKLDRNACVAELSKLHVHLPVKLPNDNSEVSCTVTMH